MYQKIGWWKGPNATAEARTLVCEFWRAQGDQGLRWLVSRLRLEGHVDLLDGVASILAQIGETAIPPVLDELERQPSRDQAEALLKALGWLGERGNAAPPPLVARLGSLLGRFLTRGRPRTARVGGPRGSAAAQGAGSGPARRTAQCGAGCRCSPCDPGNVAASTTK